ncbi:MAG: PHB depolymerase family esterase [Phycisphaeraceae bacterium]
MHPSRIALGLILAAILFITPNASADQTAKTFNSTVNGKEATLGYLLYLPNDYEAKKDAKVPLLLFLHGSGERGDNIEVLKKHGPPMLVDKGKDMPFIIVSPQCPKDQRWDSDVLKALIEDVSKSHRVDTDRLYCTGLSMGGFGTWALCTKYPQLFAAAVPICGGGNPQTVKAMKGVPTWVFHGDKDTAVKLEQSQSMVDALKEAGGEVTFTIYENVGHDSWVRAYNSKELYEWLLKQKRAK